MIDRKGPDRYGCERECVISHGGSAQSTRPVGGRGTGLAGFGDGNVWGKSISPLNQPSTKIEHPVLDSGKKEKKAGIAKLDDWVRIPIALLFWPRGVLFFSWIKSLDSFGSVRSRSYQKGYQPGGEE